MRTCRKKEEVKEDNITKRRRRKKRRMRRRKKMRKRKTNTKEKRKRKIRKKYVSVSACQFLKTMVLPSCICATIATNTSQ